MKITITRSFTKTKQIAAYEPINASCTASTEYEVFGDGEERMLEVSAQMDTFARSEVEKTIQSEMTKHAARVEAAKEANKF